jgi:magnesium-protoporphyrin O-methyltransferase
MSAGSDMPQATTYQNRRGELEAYFDRTAVENWKRLTSDAPVSGIRATVRKGRDQMRATLLSWLPDDLNGAAVLDAGCGTGALAIEAARRGARVVGIDLSANLVSVARERLALDPASIRVELKAGDMLEPNAGRFAHVVAMDSLIHYRAPDMVNAIARLASHCDRSMVITFAPRTMALSAMHFAGTMFPRSDRAPAIEPVSPTELNWLIERHSGLSAWRCGRTQRIASGFYTSQALELVRQ